MRLNFLLTIVQFTVLIELSNSSFASRKKANQEIVKSFQGKTNVRKKPMRRGQPDRIGNSDRLVKRIKKAVHKCAENLAGKELPRDDAITIGDVIYQPEQMRRFDCMKNKKSKRQKRLTSHDYEVRKWPQARVYYKYHDDFNVNFKIVMRRGIKIWEKNTCVRFVEGSPPQNSITKGYALIKSDELDSCMYTTLGYIPPYKGQMTVNIPAENCSGEYDAILPPVRAVIHELGHVLGLEHQHIRPDRDDYIEVNSTSTQSVKCAQYECKDFGTPYDFGSVMHYDLPVANATALISRPNEMDLEYEHFAETAGSSLNWGTFYDFLMVNQVYCDNSCGKDSPKIGDIDENGTAPFYGRCRNGGYPHPNDCSRCLCPEGWQGTRCQNLEKPFPSRMKCGARVNVESDNWEILKIKSPTIRFHPIPLNEFYRKCTYVFKVSSKLKRRGFRIQLGVDGPKSDDLNWSRSKSIFWKDKEPCNQAYLEVRYRKDLKKTGPRCRTFLFITSKNKFSRICKHKSAHDDEYRNYHEFTSFGSRIMLLFRAGVHENRCTKEKTASRKRKCCNRQKYCSNRKKCYKNIKQSKTYKAIKCIKKKP